MDGFGAFVMTLSSILCTTWSSKAREADRTFNNWNNINLRDVHYSQWFWSGKDKIRMSYEGQRKQFLQLCCNLYFVSSIYENKRGGRGRNLSVVTWGRLSSWFSWVSGKTSRAGCVDWRDFQCFLRSPRWYIEHVSNIISFCFRTMKGILFQTKVNWLDIPCNI